MDIALVTTWWFPALCSAICLLELSSLLKDCLQFMYETVITEQNIQGCEDMAVLELVYV